MTNTAYFIGQMVRVTFTVRDITNVLANTTAAAKVYSPTLVVTALTLVNDSTGVYHADFTPTEPGLHQVRFVGTGAVATAQQDAFIVETQTTP